MPDMGKMKGGTAATIKQAASGATATATAQTTTPDTDTTTHQTATGAKAPAFITMFTIQAAISFPNAVAHGGLPLCYQLLCFHCCNYPHRTLDTIHPGISARAPFSGSLLYSKASSAHHLLCWQYSNTFAFGPVHNPF